MDIKQAFGSCPRCGTGVDYRDQITVCGNCGWMPTPSENKSKFSKSILILSIVSLLAFMHVINWGGHSFEIIGLKSKNLLGVASLQDVDRMAVVCEEQLKYDCAVDALNQKADRTEASQDFKKLGDLHRRMSHWEPAIQAYEKALSKIEDHKKQKSLKADSYYGLAYAHHSAGDLAVADGYYKKALRLKPGVLQVTVTTDYVRMLKQAGRIKDAKRVIASAERKSGSKGRFAKLVDL